MNQCMCQCVISGAIRNSVRNFIFDIGSVCDTRFDCLLVQISLSMPKLIQTESLCVWRSLRHGIRFDRVLILSEHLYEAYASVVIARS